MVRRLLLPVVACLLSIAGCGSSPSTATKDSTTTFQRSRPPGGLASTGDAAACGAALKKYHDDLVATNDNLSTDQEAADQAGTVNNCTRALWLSEVMPYVGSNNAIVIGNTSPQKVLSAFCSDNRSAPACK